MHTLPADWSSLLALSFMLGMKHGLDADHLATIDGLTRFNAQRNPALAPYCGMFFSLGHGAVVMLIASGVAAMAGHWTIPDWFGALGSIISIGFLAVLGSLNLVAVLQAGTDEPVHVHGLTGHLLGRLLGSLRHASHPLAIAVVGILFALSFDTLSQALFFALTATQFGGWQHALVLAVLFVCGMALTDGLNGWWIAHLIARADRLARLASRAMGLVVALISLSVAALGAAKMLSPAVEAWSQGKELAFGLSVVLIVALAFIVARKLAERLDPA
jgi:high-affinity nickel-transport protein